MATIEERLTSLEKMVEIMFESLQSSRISIIDGFKIIDSNFKEVNTKLEALSKDTTSGFKDVALHIVDLKDEISKINEITKYEEQISNLKAIQGGKN